MHKADFQTTCGLGMQQVSQIFSPTEHYSRGGKGWNSCRSSTNASISSTI